MGGYFLIVGLACFFGGCWLCTRRLAFFMQAGRAQGRVVDCLEHPDPEGGAPLYEAVVAFTTDDWRDVRFTASRGSLLGRPLLEATVPVYYRKEKPEEAFIADFIGFWAAPIALWVLGLAGVAAGLTFHI